jgi:hypothetical protein
MKHPGDVIPEVRAAIAAERQARRYTIAKECLAAILKTPDLIALLKMEGRSPVEYAVHQTDALLEELER